MADSNHYEEAAAGLEAAAKALRACGAEESSEDESSESSDKQPTNLRDAAKVARDRFAQARSAAKPEK